MSKKIAILFILLSIISHSFLLIPKTTLAETPSCSSIGIVYKPNVFSSGSSDIKLDFEMKNPNTATTLNGKLVRLRIIAPLLGLDVRTNNPTNPVTSDTFSINVLDIDDIKIAGINVGALHQKVVDALKSRNQLGVLQWKPDPSKDFTDFCKDVNYSVTNPNTCNIDPTLKPEIPLGKPLTVKFAGKPTTDYTLQKLSTSGADTLGTTKTNNAGQGSFDNIIIPGNHGDSFEIIITTSDNAIACKKPITLLINAAPLNPPPDVVPTAGPGGVATSGAAPKVCNPGDPKCTSGGGEPCDNNDPNNPGFKTAIGCIHTNPAEFAKDILKFAIGIGGGLAFLMMLLGAYQMLTSQGNPDLLKAGQERLTSAVIGLLFVIFAVLFLQIIGFGILGIPGFSP